MITHVFSDATTWPTIIANRQRFDETLRWLRANGIDPCDVPTDTTLTVETTDTGTVIRYDAYLRDEHGRKYLADPHDDTKGAAREQRTTPLTVPPPAYWSVGAIPDQQS